jgi:transcriptional regulator EpsA
MTMTDKVRSSLRSGIADDIVGLCRECRDLSTIISLRSFVQDRIRDILPHQIAMFGLCGIRDARVIRLINVDFPHVYLQRIMHSDQTIKDGLLKDWIRGRCSETSETPIEPCLGEPVDRIYGTASFACHGIMDLDGLVSTYFVFANIDSQAPPVQSDLVRLIVPHLHEALMRLLSTSPDDVHEAVAAEKMHLHHGEVDSHQLGAIDVTDREQEILWWISSGKTNWEIGQVLHISEYTVKNHIQNAMRKLSVATRTQAVTKALALGILESDSSSHSDRSRRCRIRLRTLQPNAFADLLSTRI